MTFCDKTMSKLLKEYAAMRRMVALFAVSLTAALLVALFVVNVAGASATDEGGRIFSSSITPDLGPQVEPTIAGIAPGGLPWVLKSGHVTLSSNGQLEASVEGLLFGPGAPSNLIGTRGPITTVSASLVCANGPTVTTDPVAFSTEGNAHFHQTIEIGRASCR